MKPLDRLPVGALATREALPFEFNGRPYVGLQGDTLAAALLANGVGIVGRSFKLHRPRGLFGYGVEEPNGLLQLESGGFDEPNVRATMVPLYAGLKARSQNAWPSVRFDLLGVLDAFHRVLPASFYYKSMMWPNWAFYERFVRPIAGLGRAPVERDAQRYDKLNLHCDLLVCGGGPSGLMAALTAGRAGLQVILADDKETFGGLLLGESDAIDDFAPAHWVRHIVEALQALPNVRLYPRTTVSGYYENNFLIAAQRLTNHVGPGADKAQPRERLLRIRALRVVLATGALERPMVFTNNDRPGVMLASGVRHYANRHGIVPGRQVVVFTNNNDAYRTAFDLHDLGVRDITVVDSRATGSKYLSANLAARRIRHFMGHAVHDVRGRKRLRGVAIAAHAGDGRLEGPTTLLACDLLAVSSGWTPTVHLYSQAGGRLRYDPARVCLVPDGCAQAVSVVGAANGDFAFSACVEGGMQAGAAAVAAVTSDSRAVPPVSAPRIAEDHGLVIEPFWYTTNRPTDQQWLDLQYDVKVADVELAIRENFTSVEHVKRYTTGGMSIDQGKSSNFNILAVMARLTGRSISEVGTTKFRPPFQPVTLGTLAGPTTGASYAPWKELPAHAFHKAHGAHFGDYGWRRPECYLRSGEDIAAATRREVLAVRQGVGMFDGSPLGKIEVSGPDAAAFLHRMYVNNILSLKPGCARYAMLANDNGVLIDDGVIVRLAADRFLVHATSAAVDRVSLLFEEMLRCEWPELRVHVNNVTTQWGNVTLSGPKSRLVMQTLASDIDFSADRLKHMEFREGRLGGARARILRTSFTGEMTFEISVYGRHVPSLFETVHAAGLPFGIVPYGIEALEVMRTEKGYLHVGGDTDGTTNPLDIGWGAIIQKKQGDFIGRRSLQRPADQQRDRFQFVGLEALDPQRKLPVGGHIVAEARPLLPVKSQGYVTSSCLSPTLHKAIGLGLVQAGLSRLGETVHVYDNRQMVPARIVPVAHFDPQGARLHA
jgi:sarcosine oxidase subunit alpha